MQKNDTLTLNIIDHGIKGEGVARHNGFVVFIPYALTGETVKAKILKVNKNFAYAKLLEVISPSPMRTTPSCEYFYKCGGCHLMHMTYEEQLKFKTNFVKTTLAKAGIEAEVNNTVPSPKILGYRNKLQLPVSSDKIGFFRDNSHDIVDINICAVVGDTSQKIIAATREYLNSTTDTAYDEATHTGNIRHVVVRIVNEDVLITIVSNEGKIEDEPALVTILKKYFSSFGLYLNTNNKKSNIILGDTYRHIYGKTHLDGKTCEVSFKILPDVFVQINDQIAAQIYTKVAEFVRVASPDAVIDAYSGVSVLSAYVSAYTNAVYAIELNPNSHALAEEVKHQNNAKNLTNICGDTAWELPKLLKKLDKTKPFSLILDPPRKGCDPTVLEAIIAARPTQIIYISCSPATLARDLKALSSTHNITSITPYDLFPQTHHVETLVCLALKN